ncbi:hypothetical protein GGR56DRAFT_17732 [Xylariaceae sp. FL0804]|nr:hypothetical protein GGR56DRAFT_17732 [Xylariaceae sp. FL0804]
MVNLISALRVSLFFFDSGNRPQCSAHSRPVFVSGLEAHDFLQYLLSAQSERADSTVPIWTTPDLPYQTKAWFQPQFSIHTRRTTLFWLTEVLVHDHACFGLSYGSPSRPRVIRPWGGGQVFQPTQPYTPAVGTLSALSASSSLSHLYSNLYSVHSSELAYHRIHAGLGQLPVAVRSWLRFASRAYRLDLRGDPLRSIDFRRALSVLAVDQ